MLIATVGLAAGMALAGVPAWPEQRAVAVIAVVATAATAATGYTIYSEYLNTVVGQSWSYTETIPRLPWLGTGLSPLAQWLIVPVVALVWAGRAEPVRRGARPGNKPRQLV